MSVTGFNSDVIGQINQFASASYTDFFMFGSASLSTFYLSPVFNVTGSLSASPGVPTKLTLTSVFDGAQVDTLLTATAPTDGSILSIDQMALPIIYPAIAGDIISMRVTLSADIMNFALTGLLPGDYGASIDFDGTSEFVGFSVFEDAAMTMAVTSGVSITTPDGDSINIIDPGGPPTSVPEPSTLGVLGVAVLGLLMRRHQLVPNKSDS